MRVIGSRAWYLWFRRLRDWFLWLWGAWLGLLRDFWPQLTKAFTKYFIDGSPLYSLASLRGSVWRNNQVKMGLRRLGTKYSSQVKSKVAGHGGEARPSTTSPGLSKRMISCRKQVTSIECPRTSGRCDDFRCLRFAVEVFRLQRA